MNKKNLKNCPFCAEEIQREAKKCKHCGEWLINKTNSAERVKTNEKLTKEQQKFIDSFSFGAMFGVPWWSLYMKYYWGLVWTVLLFIPFAAPIVALFFGGLARKLAWKTRNWSSFEEFSQRAKKIESFCLGLFIVGVVVGFIAYGLNK